MKLFVKVALAASVLALAMARPAQADLLGIDDDTGDLYNVSTSTAGLTLIGSTGISGIGEIEFSPGGTLYGFTVGGGSTLYTINPTTAVATSVGPLGLPFVFEGGLAFSPSGTAYATNGDSADNPQLLTINLTTGAATVVGTISGGAHDIDGLAYRSDGKLIGLDRVTNSLLLIDPTTAAASTLAAVPATVGAVGGMTIQNGVGYYNTGGPGATIPGSNELYSFDLTTGASTLIGSFSSITGTGISGLAGISDQTTVPEPGTVALFVATGLGSASLLLRRHKAARK